MTVTRLNHRVANFEHLMPEGFKDDSNGNDVCASIYSEKLGLKVFIDHKYPNKREESNYPRFAVCKTNDDGEIEDSINDIVFQSEDWGSIIANINTSEYLK